MENLDQIIQDARNAKENLRAAQVESLKVKILKTDTEIETLEQKIERMTQKVTQLNLKNDNRKKALAHLLNENER